MQVNTIKNSIEKILDDNKARNITCISLKNKSYEEVACEIIFPYVNENIEKLDLQKQLVEKREVKTNVIHFQYVDSKLNGIRVSVTTRLHYDDPSNLSPNKTDGSDPINCYVTFPGRDDLSVVELGDRSEQPIVSKYHLETLNVSFNDFINLKNSKCQFN